MGLFGSAIGGSLGSEAGNFIGRKTHNKLAGKISGGVLSATGKVLGTVGGAMLPFATGGKVPGKKGKPVPAILHSGNLFFRLMHHQVKHNLQL